VDRSALYARGKCGSCETIEIAACLADELKSRAGIQLCERLQSALERCRGFVNLRMRDDRDGVSVSLAERGAYLGRRICQLPPDQTVAMIELQPSPIEYSDTLPGKFATYT